MKTKKNALEWTVFGVSAVIIAAMVALLIHDATTSEEKALPDLRVTLGEPAPRSGGYVVPVVVANVGDATAEQARIQIVLRSGKDVVEIAELMIAFVPRKSQREASVVFRRDPACCEMVAHTIAYETP